MATTSGTGVGPSREVGYWAWRAVLKRDPCAYCGTRARTRKQARKRWTVDHIHPRCAGGSDAAGNLAGACYRCNTVKNGTPLLLFLLGS